MEIRRNAGVAALVGAARRRWRSPTWRVPCPPGGLDWVFGLVLGAIGVSQLVSLVDSRTPLLVADGFGIRLRLGREWRGLPWDSLEQVVVEPRTSLLRDGRLVVAPRHLNRALEGLDRKARRQVALSQKLYAAPLVVPLGMTTRVSTDDLVAELARLSHDRATVVEVAGYVAQPVEPDPTETVSRREADPGDARARPRSTSPTAAPRSRATSRAPRGCEVAWARSCPASATDGPTTSTPTSRATSPQRRRQRQPTRTATATASSSTEPAPATSTAPASTPVTVPDAAPRRRPTRRRRCSATRARRPGSTSASTSRRCAPAPHPRSSPTTSASRGAGCPRTTSCAGATRSGSARAWSRSPGPATRSHPW